MKLKLIIMTIEAAFILRCNFTQKLLQIKYANLLFWLVKFYNK